MITETQKRKFKKVLGSHYTAKVKAVLKEKGVTDSFGKTHSSKMITNVFNNETTHVLIEDAILEAVKIQNKANKSKERKKAKLLKTLE